MEECVMARFEEWEAPLGSTWDEALLGPVADLNERLLECLQQSALALEGQMSPHSTAAAGTEVAGRVPALLGALAPLWRALDAMARRRLAGCPYLLIDAAFGQPERWERLLPAAVCDAPATAAYFASREGVALVRRTLLFAWHLARSNRLGARVLLGMSPTVAERIATSRLQDLEALAERGCPWVAPRWAQHLRIWRQLLGTAALGPPERLREVQLRGLQLLAASCGPGG
jgi:hypothetical protein